MTKKTLEQIEASLTRWKTRLRRAMTAIDKLEKQKKRLVKMHDRDRGVVHTPPHPKEKQSFRPAPMTPLTEAERIAEPVLRKVAGMPSTGAVLVDDDIPAFLRRGQAAQKAADTVVAEQIKTEIEEKKRLKAKGRIATMKAKKAGETQKMPLTGKAALAAIRSAE